MLSIIVRPPKVWYSAFGSKAFSICFKGGGWFFDSVASIFPLEITVPSKLLSLVMAGLCRKTRKKLRKSPGIDNYCYLMGLFRRQTSILLSWNTCFCIYPSNADYHSKRLVYSFRRDCSFHAWSNATTIVHHRTRHSSETNFSHCLGNWTD